jgi:hypothetical protein
MDPQNIAFPVHVPANSKDLGANCPGAIKLIRPLTLPKLALRAQAALLRRATNLYEGRRN